MAAMIPIISLLLIVSLIVPPILYGVFKIKFEWVEEFCLMGLCIAYASAIIIFVLFVLLCSISIFIAGL